MAENDVRRERDMILAPNEFMFVSDETKGHVDVFVGPTKQSLSGTDQPVIFDQKMKRFRKADFKDATQLASTAPEGWYIVLKNPAKEHKHPHGQGKMSSAELTIGRKVNIPGPVSFCLWPGQMAKVLPGHRLRSNQYLLARVYDEEAARENWRKAIIKTRDAENESKNPDPNGDQTNELSPPKDLKDQSKSDVSLSSDDAAFRVDADLLTMGQLIVIRGTEVSFYIPPTGIEIVADEHGNLVRDAVTLESLEYCLLRDENGNKRYEQGPAVVFPRPTEVFADREIKVNNETKKTRKFRAIELTEKSGIYVKVTANYEEFRKSYKVGDELFITGKDQMIYFPREEHAIVKYDNSEIHYGIAIPAGEGRYVLNRITGQVKIVKGPEVYLPDPRVEVIAKRALDMKLCSFLYPGNKEAMEHNAQLLGIDPAQAMLFDSAPIAMAAGAAAGAGGYEVLASNIVSNDATKRGLSRDVARTFTGDSFHRPVQYTKPRTITLNTKYEGAVSVDIWTGYAMLLVRKSGERKVKVGPQTVMLEYDESPQVLALSTGRPKTTDGLYQTVFLRVNANKISDVIHVETSDFCRLDVKLSYRVSFEGDDHEKWFEVENYVKFMCDHMRSRVRNAVRHVGIEDFYRNHTDILRDVILGKGEEGKSRDGFLFRENNMRVYDVEVLDVTMQNSDVEKLLIEAQRDSIKNTLSISKARKNLEFTVEAEEIKRKELLAKDESEKQAAILKEGTVKRNLQLNLAELSSQAETNEKKAENDQAVEEAKKIVAEIATARTTLEKNAAHGFEVKAQELKLKQLEAEAKAIVDKIEAVSPDLISALNGFGERAMVEKVAQAMAPLAILGGDSVMDVAGRLLQGTDIGKHLLPKKNGVNPSDKTV